MPALPRPLAALLAGAALLAACSGTADPASDAGADPVAAPTADGGTRTVEHHFGTTEIPLDPQRIVTPTQDQNALLPLLELGVTPVASAGHELSDGTQVFRRVEGYDTSGIGWLNPYGGEVDYEAVALARPDLIVVEEFGGADSYDQLSAIAPTVGVQIFDRPLTEALMAFADLVGRTEQAEALREAHEARVAALIEDLGDRRDRLSVSIITDGDPGQFYRADTGQALGTVTDALDLLRPEPQTLPESFDAAYSIETLDAHDADVLLIVDYSGEGQSPGLDALQAAPTYDGLAAVRAGQVHVLDGTAMVGAAWGKMDAFLAELERILLAPDLDVDVVAEGT